MSQGTVVILVVALGIVALAIVSWMAAGKMRTERLKGKFGREYDREVREAGDGSKGEEELEARRKRVSKLSLKPLTPEEQRRFGERWTAAQVRFVDDPKG